MHVTYLIHLRHDTTVLKLQLQTFKKWNLFECFFFVASVNTIDSLKAYQWKCNFNFTRKLKDASEFLFLLKLWWWLFLSLNANSNLIWKVNLSIQLNRKHTPYSRQFISSNQSIITCISRWSIQIRWIYISWQCHTIITIINWMMTLGWL